MKELLAIVGDIHGDAGRLASLLKAVKGRRLIFVGDYINRGKDSNRTLTQLIRLRQAFPSTVFLRGNHEQSFLEYLSDDLPFYKFASMGGLSTLKSYLTHASHDIRSEVLNVLPQEHLGFIEACGDYLETEEMIVSHCGIDPSNPDSRARADMVMESHNELFAGHFHPQKLVICGHYVQPSRLPYICSNLICIDTGCGTSGGPLTALLLPERIFVQR
jgi:serine/threonine protein phosphatase 1